ncbi:xanthine dehydrogenase family protein molybdopterin-binding subunit [Mycolicibacterium smegmatis]|uniref:Carbon-monoxide dehydrogenase n=1 Tax=Mycolicibacterium smegmatis (strain ATCC 700084 / mc(2)155) TaxID=246196 RepID=A0QV64_MYCS2|nr:xanthine dehydrogenase family protein molybdopterin-binding subunit [Mycolicibacterium smegmatis]ABK74659.1 carbon-monoxide dehydrogenase [Mycolicibacterium smegmatis MC2 155]AIU07645.1 carbon monoxide dehydrogenase [Mycolicibacterium smegmatis MC2 155]AIU14270.1 carbon monoxide dehydrogenase [Mycolicibacterium smegmatis]AIU20893.1 carbon monoxide dehydrogenase [Mycolicibacterium smegmatis]MCC3337604.1 xanthine dehydrogenase family protein molybdopterin-binding subunit [Mycolicibacterium sm
MTSNANGRGLIGSSVRRREDDRMLGGRGHFVADLSAGAHHVVFLRSTEPHADITRIDTAAATRMPGVIGVFTADDLGMAGACIPSLTTPDESFTAATSLKLAEQRLPVIASDRVYFVGQPVAAVIAEDRYRAEDAAEAIEVDYVSRPAVADPAEALQPRSPVLFDHLDSNAAARIHFAFGDPESAFTRAAAVVSGTYRMNRHGAVPLECRGVIADFDVRRQRVEITTSTQVPHMVRNAICAVTGWSQADVVVSVPDVGGGFGTKANVYAEEILLARLARETRRRLIWVEDRQEHLVASAQGRDQIHHTRLAVDEQGRILAWADDFVVDIGAGSLWVAGIVANTAIHLLGPYRVPAAEISGRAALTNKTLVAQYRGAGRPEATFALERSLDAAARELGLSGVEIRRRNLLTSDDLPYPRPIPYRDGVPIEYDGGDYRACLESVLEALPRDEIARCAAEHPQYRIGYGLSSYLEATGRGPHETARIRLSPDGRFEVTAGAASAGQGHETVFAQVAAEALAVPMEQVIYTPGDTEWLPEGVGTFASRSAVLAGSAVHRAARELVGSAIDRVARLIGADPDDVQYRDGCFSVGGRPALDWADLVRAAGVGGALETGGMLDVSAVHRVSTVTWTMGVHAAIVGVHRRTGIVKVLRYAVSHEGGREINPQIVEGQIIGGVAQGIGGTLFERWAYSEAGQPQSTTFAAYHLPLTTDVPRVRVRHLHVDTPANPLGVRGVGESGTIAVYAAVASAVDDALDGRVHIDTTPIATGDLCRVLARTAS